MLDVPLTQLLGRNISRRKTESESASYMGNNVSKTNLVKLIVVGTLGDASGKTLTHSCLLLLVCWL